MTMKIYAFADEAGADLDTQVQALKANGLDGLEIRNVDGKSISDLTEGEAQEVRKRLDAEGLRVWSIGSPIGKVHIERDDFDKHLEVFRHTLDLADILGADCFRLFSFYLPQGKDPGDYRDEVIDRMGRFAELAEGRTVTLCHENEKGIYGDTAARCLDILTALPAIRAIFDPANFIQCGQDTLAAWKLLKPCVRYLHVKDALADGSVVPAGEGIGNLPFIVEDFLSDGGSVFTIEPHLAVFSGLASLEKDDARSAVGKYEYESSMAAFCAACTAFKKICNKRKAD